MSAHLETKSTAVRTHAICAKAHCERYPQATARMAKTKLPGRPQGAICQDDCCSPLGNQEYTCHNHSYYGHHHSLHTHTRLSIFPYIQHEQLDQTVAQVQSLPSACKLGFACESDSPRSFIENARSSRISLLRIFSAQYIGCIAKDLLETCLLLCVPHAVQRTQKKVDKIYEYQPLVFAVGVCVVAATES